MKPAINRSCGVSGRLTPDDDCFTDLADGEAIVLPGEHLLNTFDRFHEWLVAQPKRLMVYRHDQARPCRIGHHHRLFGSAVVIDPWVVGTDGHHCGVEGPVLAMTLERSCLRRVAA